MNKLPIRYSCLILLSLLLLPLPVTAREASSRYITLQYESSRTLREFNDKLIIGRKLTSMMRKRNVETVEDEVLAKVDILVEKTQVVLDMFPKKIHITLVVLPDDDDVEDMYEKTYGRRQDNIAYYSLSQKTIYISADDTNLRVLAHEMGHAVVDQYFEVRPPYKIHELMAQFTEKHITD